MITYKFSKYGQKKCWKVGWEREIYFTHQKMLTNSIELVNANICIKMTMVLTHVTIYYTD